MQNNTYKRHWPQWLIPMLGSTCLTLLIIGTLFWFQAVDALPTFGMDAATTAVTATTIPHQGYVADADSRPLTGQQDMTFKLYNQPIGSSPLWTEERRGVNRISVDDGLFNVMLGNVTLLPQSMITENDILYLGIAIGSDAEMTPRVQLGRMPYAVVADTVRDGSISDEKLNLAHGESCLPGGDLEQVMTGSHVPEELSNPKLSFTLEQPSLVAVSMNGLARLIRSSRTPHSVHLMVDGRSVLGSHEYEPNDWFNLKGQKLMHLDPGEHVLQLKANSAASGTMVLRGALHWRACVSYLVLGEQ